MFFLSIASIFSLTYAGITALVSQYGYLAILVLMLLEAAAFPVPSEVVLPAVGLLAAEGTLDPFITILAVIVGGIVGMGVDYYIAYFLGKDVVYKHLAVFHIRKERLDAFDSWFAKNGTFAVFIARLVPVVRALINFPAGFAQMPARKFFAYSIAGTLIWDVLLVAFGYYALSISSFPLVIASVFVFALALYLIYRFAMKRMR